MARRGALVAVLALAERLLTSATGAAVFDGSHGPHAALSAKIGVALALGLAFTAHQWIWRAFAARSEADLAARAVESLLTGDVLRANVLPADDAQTEIVQATYVSAQVISHSLPTLIGDALASVLLGCVIASREPPRVVGFAVLLILGAALALVLSRGRLHQGFARAWELQALVSDAIVDALLGRVEIAAAAARSRFVAMTEERSRIWGSASARVAAAGVLSSRLPLIAMAGVVGLVIVLGGWRPEGSSLSLADLALFATAAPAFAGVAQGLQTVAQSERWLRIVAEILADARPISRVGQPVEGLSDDIVFDLVSFRYEDGAKARDVLHDLSFRCAGGETLALAGANGSGKSTCLRLILGLRMPNEGTIRAGTVSLSELDLEAWRGRIAFLPQRPYLPPRSSVEAAIRFLVPDASDERIQQALERVGLMEALRASSDRPLDVQVDRLSVGQRQRLALARFLCRDARLFLLDEPDANLDRAGITLVAALVRDLASRGTVILAAHTPELLEVAHRVITLKDGRTTEDG
jgi:ABC-type multidrug transport system fused ATPase/permease subunit